MTDKLIAKRDGPNALKVTRDFDVPRGDLWRAFTDPDVLRHWLPGPPGWLMDRCFVDARTGGGYEWGWRHPKTGAAFGCTGHYADVQPERLMVDTQTFHQGDRRHPMADTTENHVVFTDVAGGCRVVTRILYPDAETRELVMGQNMVGGMAASYAKLDRHLMGQTLQTGPEHRGLALANPLPAARI